MVSVKASLLCLNQGGSTDVQNAGLVPNAERVLHSVGLPVLYLNVQLQHS